jgi:hypothetical protein
MMRLIMMIFENVHVDYNCSGRMEIVSGRNLGRIIRGFFLLVFRMVKKGKVVPVLN